MSDMLIEDIDAQVNVTVVASLANGLIYSLHGRCMQSRFGAERAVTARSVFVGRGQLVRRFPA